MLVSTIVVAMLSACADHDRVLFTNENDEGEIGILLDGNLDGSDVNDQSFTATATGHVDPGIVTSGAHDEVIGFQQERPVEVAENAGWTADDDDVTVPFANEMGAKFYVWIVEGPYSDQYTRAVSACIKLDEIWENERTGTQISLFDVEDKTGDEDADDFADFTCAAAADIRNDIGFNSNGVNIYYVDRVDFGNGFSTGNGVWCGNNTVVMGSGTSDHLAAHEVGHAFQLSHVNSLTTNFDQTNVMHNASNTREYLTEGQNFRAHLEPGSVINSTYNLRPGKATRDCGNTDEAATNECPAIQKRIWADGTFPAN